MVGRENIQRFAKANEEIELLNRQFLAARRSSKFRQARSHGVKNADPKKQHFVREAESIRESFLIEKGLITVGDGKAGASEKHSLMGLIVKSLPHMKTINEYRVLSETKMKSAIRTDDGDYELAFTVHKEPVVEDIEEGRIEVVGKLRPHVQEIADLLTKEQTGVVRIKNNQITFVREDGKQFSLRITKKKKELF